MNVSFPIPKELESYVEVQIQSGNYANVGDYFLSLLQQDRLRKEAQAKLARILFFCISLYLFILHSITDRLSALAKQR